MSHNQSLTNKNMKIIVYYLFQNNMVMNLFIDLFGSSLFIVLHIEKEI